jgi:predicted nucleic acid-binding protein
MAVTEGLVDTSVFIAREAGRPIAMELLPNDVVVSVVTVAELRAGVLAADDPATRAQRLSTLTLAMAFESIPIDDEVAEAWARLRVDLRSLDRRMPVNDSWIAATAMALRIPVVTQDADYITLPGLDVIRV